MCQREGEEEEKAEQKRDRLFGRSCVFMFVCFTSGQLGEGPLGEEEERKRGACLDEILCHITTYGS